MSLSVNIGRPFLNDKTLDEQARSILRKYGTDAHVYIPGAGGVAVSGLTAGNYTLSDGSSGYSAIDGTCGLALDAAGSVGADLLNGIGAFDSATGWTLTQPTSGSVSISGGALTINSVDGSWAAAAANGYTVVANSTYYFEIDATTTGGQGIRVELGGVSSVQFTGAGVFTGYIKATNTSSPLVARGGATANSGAVVRSLVIREVTGIHATQSTTANKPALRRGLYNLLTYSNDLSNAAWLTANGATKDSATTASVTSATNSTLIHYVSGLTTGSIYTAAVQISGPAGTQIKLRLEENGGAFSGTDTPITLSTTPTIYAASFTVGATTQLGLLVRSVGTACQVTIGGAGLFAGTLTAAQILAEGGIPLTTSAAASNSGAGRYSWQFDGTNDSLALGSVPFQMADDFAVIAGAQVNSAALLQGIVLPSASPNDYVGAITTGGSAGVLQFGCRNDAHTYFSTNIGTFSVGEVFVASGVNRSGSVKGRKNAGAWSGTVTPTGVFTMTLGQFGALGPFNNFGGNLGPVILIKGTVSDADLLTLERWVASQTPNGPSF